MKEEDTLRLVSDLISRTREGVYWDFKQKHHENKAELVHDVLCLANADWVGSRYLVYGIEDQTFGIVGVPQENRRNQANLVSFFRDIASKFEAGRTPTLRLWSVSLSGKNIDVLEIADKPEKPYRLLECYKCRGVTVLPAIYSRIEDTNTPIDKSASSDQVEVMFRERFGLNLQPYERLKHLLKDEGSWKSWENGIYFHNAFPEYTYKFDDDVEALDEEWVRGEVGHSLPEGSQVILISFRYYGTKIGEVGYVSFDHGKKRAIRPSWAPYRGGRVYFYEEGSLAFAMQQHISKRDGNDHSSSVSDPANRGCKIRIEVLSANKVKALWETTHDDVITDTKRQNEIFSSGMRELSRHPQTSSSSTNRAFS